MGASCGTDTGLYRRGGPCRRPPVIWRSGGEEAKWLSVGQWLGLALRKHQGDTKKGSKMKALEWSSWLVTGEAGRLGVWGQSSKISPGGLKMRPKWGQNTSQRAPWRPSGRPLGAEVDFGLFFGAIWDPQIVKIGAEVASTIEHRFGATFLNIWRPLGAIWGSIWGPFWGRF